MTAELFASLQQKLRAGRQGAVLAGAHMDLGVASFATDHPDVVMQAIRDYYARGRQGGTRPEGASQP